MVLLNNENIEFYRLLASLKVGTNHKECVYLHKILKTLTRDFY